MLSKRPHWRSGKLSEVAYLTYSLGLTEWVKLAIAWETVRVRSVGWLRLDTKWIAQSRIGRR